MPEQTNTPTSAPTPIGAISQEVVETSFTSNDTPEPPAPSIIIDDEFRDLIPPLSPEEFSGLEASIKREGCRDAIVLWGKTIVDGHNRFEICTRLHKPFGICTKHFDDRHAAMIWIIRNQFDRRNLSAAQRMDLALLLKAEIQTQAQARMKAGKAVDPVANLPQGKTRDQVAALAGVSGRTLDKYEVVRNTAAPEVVEAVRANEVSVHRAAEIAKLPANEQVEAVRLPRVALNTGNNEWYTPTAIVEAARQAMGSIDTDPASCAQANDTVQASTFYTAEQNGLAQTWAGNVWLNPPYSSPLIGQFVEAITAKYVSGEIAQATVITNNCTDTRWAHLLFEHAAAVCFTLGRVRFYNAALEEAKKNSPLQGQTIFYFGPRVAEFTAAFTEFGAVLRPVEVAA